MNEEQDQPAAAPGDDSPPYRDPLPIWAAYVLVVGLGLFAVIGVLLYARTGYLPG